MSTTTPAPLPGARSGVFVIGSVSRDTTVTVRSFPGPGETVVGSSVVYGLGGKGANQAVAAALAGADTEFLGCVGEDPAGRDLLERLGSYGVGTGWVRRLDGEDSGTAHITVDERGENCIAIVPAANRRIGPEQVEEAFTADLGGASVVACPGEIPPETIERIGRCTAGHPARWVLNLAPAVEVSAKALTAADVLVVNESEAAALTARHGLDDAAGSANLARALTALSPAVILTAGAAGAEVAVRTENGIEGGAESVHVPATRVDRVVDTTGAGDAFVGVLSAALDRGLAGGADPANDNGGDQPHPLPPSRPLPLDLLARCARIASREAASVVGAPGAAASYSRFTMTPSPEEGA